MIIYFVPFNFYPFQFLFLSIFTPGNKDAGNSGSPLWYPLGTLPDACRLQLVQHPIQAVLQRVVPLLLSRMPLSEQCGQPDPLQLYVHQVPAGLHQTLLLPR